MKRFISSVYGTTNEDRFPGCQPVSIERKHLPLLKASVYAVCEKTDGVRYMLACFSDELGRKLCVLVDRTFNPTYTTLCVPRDTLLDGELIGDTYVVHDAMMIQGENVMQLPLTQRLARVKQLNIPTTPGNPIVSVKTMYYMDNIRSVKQGPDTDGLIFTPIYEPVRMGTHEKMFKWKPLKHITIDFMMRGGTLSIQDGSPITNDTHTWYTNEMEGKIVECEFRDGEWRFVKMRPDKDFANNRRTFERTMVNIYEDIKFEEFLRL